MQIEHIWKRKFTLGKRLPLYHFGSYAYTECVHSHVPVHSCEQELLYGVEESKSDLPFQNRYYALLVFCVALAGTFTLHIT